MKEDMLGLFINEMLSKDIDEEEFKQYIDLFSRFLSYCNPDYRYNGTYLCQFVDDFIEISEMLKKKDEIYRKILLTISRLGYNYDLLIDQVFWAGRISETKYESVYIKINKDKIVSKQIELKIKFIFEETEYIYCKKYTDFQDNKLIQMIKKDIKAYIKNKDIRRTENEFT